MIEFKMALVDAHIVRFMVVNTIINPPEVLPPCFRDIYRVKSCEFLRWRFYGGGSVATKSPLPDKSRMKNQTERSTLREFRR